MRRKIVAGNWKMNKTREQAHDFFKALGEKQLRENHSVIICPPFTSIAVAREYADHFGFSVGAQDFYMPVKNGAMTGEISTEMLLELGVRVALVGHSERRAHSNETDQLISQKVIHAISVGILPILCIGETDAERTGGKMKSVLREQLISALHHPHDKFILAYEPVWAIGTGKTADAKTIDETHKFIKSVIGDDVKVLYGGSVNEKNVSEILSLESVDGVLVGGASLDPDKFAAIINA